MKALIGAHHPMIVATLVLLPYGITYFAISSLLGVKEATRVVRRIFAAVAFKRGE